MRLCCLLLGLFLLLPTIRAEGGAWMREEGKTFLSFGLATDGSGTDATLYVDHGLTPMLSFGLDAWLSARGDWSMMAHARFPLGRMDRRLRTAVSVALGANASAARVDPAFRLGIHLGGGLPQGWLSADLTVAWESRAAPAVGELTGTWGYRLTARCDTMIEARLASAGTGEMSPGIACRVNDSLRLRAASTHPVAGGGAPTLAIQTWVDF